MLERFLKETGVVLLGIASLFSTQFVHNFDPWAYILILISTLIITVVSSKKFASFVFITIVALSVFAFFTIGTAKHRYLVTYENGAMICADNKKEISNKCLTDRPENLGAYVKHEYIGKAFYK